MHILMELDQEVLSSPRVWPRLWPHSSPFCESLGASGAHVRMRFFVNRYGIGGRVLQPHLISSQCLDEHLTDLLLLIEQYGYRPRITASPYFNDMSYEF